MITKLITSFVYHNRAGSLLSNKLFILPYITYRYSPVLNSFLSLFKTTTPDKLNENKPNYKPKRDMNDTSTPSASAMSRLQIQSPPPPPPPEKQLPDDANPISQVRRKTRNKGFLRRLMCCFRPNSYVYKGYYDNDTVKYIINPIAFPHSHVGDTESNLVNKNNAPKYFGKSLLPPKEKGDEKICMVIDLDETLVHSSFKPINNPDFVVPVEIDGTSHRVYVLKRPHVEEFLKRVGRLYECVLFTASLSKYADPVADLLDKDKVFKKRLFRESCAFYRGNYVKDLGRLGRDLNRVIIVDNSPASYIFQPRNAVSIKKYRAC